MTNRTVDLLEADLILQEISPAARDRLQVLSVLPETDSTNSAVWRLPAKSRHGHAVLAEEQTRGRGRRQRPWHSPPGGNIYLSLGWQFCGANEPLSTLPLVVAVAVSRALSRIGLQGHGIKWPNDILVNGRKLAGILVELQSTGTVPPMAVIGIGLNVRMPGAGEGGLADVIERPWTDLVSGLDSGMQNIKRNRVAAVLLEALLDALEQYESDGFSAFGESWEKLDVLRGKSIRVVHGDEIISGEALGLAENGGLLLQTDTAGVREFHSGEVSIHYD